MTLGRSRASALLQRAARCVEQGLLPEAATSACTTSGRPWGPSPAADGPSTSAQLSSCGCAAHERSLRSLSPLGASTSAPAPLSSSIPPFFSRGFATSSAAARSAAFHPSHPQFAAAQSQQAAPDDGATLGARGQLLDSLAACLGLQHLDALLAREEHKALFDEMLLLQALDVAFRLCSSSAAITPQLRSLEPQDAYLAPSSQQQQQQQQQYAMKSGADAASDVLTRLSEVFIQLLSTPGGLSPEGAVKALRTLAMLRFNPAGDYAGLQTVSAYYRDVVLPALNPDPASGCPPELAVRAPQLLANLYFAFARLFDLAARRERELQAQLQAAALAEEEAAARREDDEEASGSGSSGGGLPPWQRVPMQQQQLPEALLGGPGTVVGDRQLYEQISHLLHGPGNPLQLLPSKSLGALATAMSTSRFMYYPLAMSIAHAVVLRLQTAAPAVGPPGALDMGSVGLQDRADAIPASTLSNILSCLTKSGFEAEALCDAAANWMSRHMGRPGASGHALVAPHHIVDVAAAFARVKYENFDFLERAADALTPKLPQSSPNAVSLMVWAVGNSKAGRSPRFEPLLSALAQRLVAMHRNSRLSTLPATAMDTGSSTDGGFGSGGGGGAGGGGAQVVPRHLATAVFAMGRLGLLQPLLMDCVAGDVVARPDSYTSRQLANVLRAFTLLDCYRPDMFEVAAGVLRARLAAQAAQAQAAGLLTGSAELQVPLPLLFTPQNYADIAWSVALAGHAPQAPELMQILADRVTEVAPRLGKACLVRAAQAFAVAGITQPQVYEAITESARPLLADLGPAYLATLVDAVAEVAVPVSEPFWLACMQAAAAKVDHLQRPRADMQSAAARLLRAFRRHPATAAFASTREHYVMPQLEQVLVQPAAY
ncbi:hypothetical protein CHLRE_03g156350v5 [Chlamydomonas reinhardtii]|uniref:Uncharacterized protein n=1 Tax=Chlamydomonas reinhardtii TaxID=3055 RepID=A0A2K3DW29_CHLRE|nr:uncharacterized protein CHLRE_03g156350v5 [Chlamydomonas reinhardtii]PNW84729.1 hypothetical protein CHLRE_03g156350v5 [Chlamydomonas reinhardtii]